MPGITLHFVMADRVFETWRRRGDAPFDPADAEARNAFWHGAVGPDLGYFPGGARALSELAHCISSGTLARTLVRTARRPEERAFAWGWVTHVLADQAIHPWIGRGVGELVHGDRRRFVDGSSDLLSHLRVEMGLDAWHASRRPALRRRRLRPVFRGREIGFLARAYASTYGTAFDEESFRRSHRAASRRVGQALATLRLVHALMQEGGGLSLLPGLGRVLRVLYGIGCLRSVTLAYLTPVPPPGWLLEGVEGEMDRHLGRFLEAWERDGATLEDWNLDTGRLQSEEADHPGAARALAALAAARSARSLSRSAGSRELPRGEAARPLAPEA